MVDGSNHIIYRVIIYIIYDENGFMVYACFYAFFKFKEGRAEGKWTFLTMSIFQYVKENVEKNVHKTDMVTNPKKYVLK